MDFLSVTNWEKYQHYKDRRPPWIKYHVELLDDYALTALDPFSQLLFDRMLLLAALMDNRVPNDPLWIANRTHLETDSIRRSVETLAETGFLLLAGCKRDASGVLASRAPARSASASVLVPLSEEEQIADAWLEHAPPLTKHTAGYFADSKVQRKLHHALRLYGGTELVEAIGRYAKILASSEHEFEHRYPFGDFLSRERKEPGCSYFLDDSCFDQWRRNGVRRGVDAASVLERAADELRADPPLRSIEGGAQ